MINGIFKLSANRPICCNAYFLFLNGGYKFLKVSKQTSNLCTILQACTSRLCGSWGPWITSSPCTVTCGTGSQTRYRVCVNGREGDEGCIGETSSTVQCSAGTCENVEGKVFEFVQYYAQISYLLLTKIILK